MSLARTHNIYSIHDLEMHYKNVTRGHWFDKDTMRFFKSRLSENLYYGHDHIYFVSSEQNGYEKRMYSVRQYRPTDGNIETIGDFQQYTSLQSAKTAAKALARGEHDL